MRAQKEDIQVRQSALNFVKKSVTGGEAHAPFIAKVIQVHSDRMTCDIKTLDGATLANIPILTKGGLVDGEVYGEMCLPAIDDYVIVGYASYGQRHKAILGTILPYLVNEFTKDAVNSGSKQFTKKLFEADKPLEYRRIFKSGTTVQIEEDGGVIIEVPSGTYIHIDEANGKILIEDQHGNKTTLDADGVIIEDGESTPNKITMSSSGIVIDDANGNDIAMESGKVTINGNLEVLQ